MLAESNLGLPTRQQHYSLGSTAATASTKVPTSMAVNLRSGVICMLLQHKLRQSQAIYEVSACSDTCWAILPRLCPESHQITKSGRSCSWLAREIAKSPFCASERVKVHECEPLQAAA